MLVFAADMVTMSVLVVFNVEGIGPGGEQGLICNRRKGLMARRRIGMECGVADPSSAGSPTPGTPFGADIGLVLSCLGISVLFSHRKPIFTAMGEHSQSKGIAIQTFFANFLRMMKMTWQFKKLTNYRRD